MEVTILIIWTLAVFIQLFYYVFFYMRLSKKISKDETFLPPVSVVICARNEEENLKKFLPLILEQDYPDYEVIVVNDASVDDTDIVLKSFTSKYPHLRVTTIKKDEKFTHNKKLALTVGIKAAKNEILLLTDADCYPVDKNWIKSMVSSYKPHTDIVLGYGGYEKNKGLLNKIIRFDALTIAMQYFSFALAGIPYMGVGRNLSYKKSLFFSNKGFANHLHLNSGDDDLFVNETANKKNVSVNLDAHTRSVPRKSFASWIIQKKRHQLTFYKYKLKHKFLIVLEPLSRWIFYGLIPLNFLFAKKFLLLFFVFFFIREFFLLLAYYFSSKTLKEKDLLLISPVFDFVFLFIYLIIKIYRNPYKKEAWK